MSVIAYLIIIVNAASWGSTDIRTTPMPSMEECQAALQSMRTITTASQAGDKSGMVAVAYCSPNPNTRRRVDEAGNETWR